MKDMKEIKEIKEMNFKYLSSNVLLINICLFAWLIPGNAAMVPIFIVSFVFILETFYIIYKKKD